MTIAATTNHRVAVRSASITFLSFAVPIAMLGIIWPDVRVRFDQSLGALGTAAFVYGIGRFSTAMTGPGLARRFGVGLSFTFVLLLLAAATAALAVAPNWPAFLAALVVIGMMSGSLDSLGAGFITSIGDVGSAGLIHGSYGVGATIGPFLVVAAPGWRSALGVAALLVVAAAGLAATARHSWPTIAVPDRTGAGRVPLRPALLSLGAFGAFVAIEVTTGQWAFTHLTEARGLGDTPAALAVSLYWGGITIGRLSLVKESARRVVDQLRLHRLAAAAGVAVLSLAILPPPLTVPALFLSGLALSPIVPSLFASTTTRIGGAHAQRLAVWQLAATNLGAISVPLLTGELVDAIGVSVIVAVIASAAVLGGILLVAISQLSTPAAT